MWDKSDILILQQSPLFSHFTSLAEIEAALHLLKANRKAFQKDECVWRAGEKVREIGVVVFGAVHIKQTDWWGNQNILNEIKARDIFGEAFATINDMREVDSRLKSFFAECAQSALLPIGTELIEVVLTETIHDDNDCQLRGSGDS